MAWINVEDKLKNRLWFRYDPERDLIEIANRGRIVLIDLSFYKDQAKGDKENADERREGKGKRAA